MGDDYDEVNDCVRNNIGNDNQGYGDDGDCVSTGIDINDEEYYGDELHLDGNYNNNIDEELIYISSLFDLVLYVPSTIFQICRDGSSWVEPVLS